MELADVTIIGAGVVGLAVGAAMADNSRTIYVLEKNNTFGAETSSRNSQVIHAGIYYPPGFWKSKTCVAGSLLLYEFCQKYNVPHRKIGKLIVATDTAEEADLEVLYQKGTANGVEGLRLLSKRDLHQMEPHVRGTSALYSPNTGIIDVHCFMRRLLGIAKSRGASLAFGSQVVGLQKVKDGYEVQVACGNEQFKFLSRVIVNCAGLWADKVAEMVGIDVESAGYKVYFCKGQYFSVSTKKSRMLNRLVYPVPPKHSGALGVHATLDLDNRLRLGPDENYVTEIEYKVDDSCKRTFYERAQQLFPFIEESDLEPEMAGIRPRLYREGEPPRDFVVCHEAERGLPGFINLLGIESPGLTSSLAIAKLVSDLTRNVL